MAKTWEYQALFSCPPDAVWAVLCSRQGYESWYGYPETTALLDIVPGFGTGAKLTFRNSRSSAVITVWETGRRAVLSSGFYQDEILLQAQGALDCLVTLRRTINERAQQNDPADNPAQGMLLRLQALCQGGVLPDPSPAMEERPSVATAVLQGYRSPVRRLKRRAGDGDLPVDNTETDVAVSWRSGLVAVLLSALLFSVLMFTFSFERSDVVPSSGLSVMESAAVNRANAELIYPGQGKNELEVMLSCRGLRLSTNEYYYGSLDKNSAGESLQQIYVRYDAYGRVRSVAYVDASRRNDILETEFWDLKSELNSDVSFTGLERLVEYPLTAFWVDKSGARTAFFGALDPDEDIFSSTLRSQLMVTMNTTERTVAVEFFLPYSRRSTLPDQETDRLLRQYRNFIHYLADRDAYERIDLLMGRRQYELDVVLGAGNYTVTDGVTAGQYLVSSPVQPDARYEYLALFDENGAAREITYKNRYLCQITGTLEPLEDYGLYRGMSLSAVYNTLQVVPVAARGSQDMLVLCFGDWHEEATLEESASLVLTIDLSTRTVIDIRYNLA